MAMNGIFTPLKGNFTMCDNAIICNASISPEARLIYTIIQAKITNPQFTIYKNTIYHLFGGSKQRFDKYWNELKQLGLLIVRKLRNEKNQFYYEYELVSVPQAQPDPDFPPMEKPENGNATTRESEGYNKTEVTNTDTQTENLKPDIIDDNDDDREEAIHHGSSLVKESLSYKNDFNLFIETWLTVTHKPILLSAKQKYELDRLITKYSYQMVLYAIEKIKESQYLMHNINITYFLKCFEKIYSDTYKDRVVCNSFNPQKTEVNPVKKTRFTQMDSRTWDFEELDRLEDEYIERRLAKSRSKVHS